MLTSFLRATITQMKHATASTLTLLASMLDELRSIEGLVEKRPGVFYRRSRAFLHFHEDPSGVFADVRFSFDQSFARVPVTTARQRSALVTKIQRSVRSE